MPASRDRADDVVAQVPDRVITDITVTSPRNPPAILSALRTDLAPLAPTVSRTVAVLATVAIADWAVRAGTRALWQEGLALAGRSLGSRGNALERAPNTQRETLIIERITRHRTAS